MKQVLFFSCLLCLLLCAYSFDSSCSECIIINSNGSDDIQCLQRNNSLFHHCKSLGYVFKNLIYLNNREVVLQGDHWLNETLILTDISGLKIVGDGTTPSTIKCPYPSSSVDEGFGLLVSNVLYLKISNVKFEGCGTLQNSTTTTRDNATIKYRSAVYIINSTNIGFHSTVFHRSIGRGLSMHDVNGQVEVYNSTFSENMPSTEETLPFGGGGFYIELTYCSPGFPRCDPQTNIYNNHSRYWIKNCTFEGNRAINREYQSHNVQFVIFDGSNAGEGGAVQINIKGFNNSFFLENCLFYKNVAVSGGSMKVLFLDYAQYNSLFVMNCIFKQNRTPFRSGGAMKMGFLGTINVTHNSIYIYNTEFVNNSAGWGGAISFFSSLSKTDLNSSIAFNKCTFEENSGAIGAAVVIGPNALHHIFDGSAAVATFSSCTFKRNKLVESERFQNVANDDLSHHELESSIVDVDSMQIVFVTYVSFVDNIGTALVANSGLIGVLENTEVVFVNNTATNGGAMALLGFSVLELHPGSQVTFESNTAHEFGGAIYATSPHQSEFIFSHRCFITFSGEYPNNPDKWNTTLIFTNNSAEYGSAIFTDSVLPCVKQTGGIYTDASAAFRWKSFKILQGSKDYTIATSPARINFTISPSIFPGEIIDVDPTSHDDLNQTIPSSFKVSIESYQGSVTSNSFIADDGHLHIKGRPGENFNITLLTQNTRHVSATKSGRLATGCPIGFVFKENTCVCSSEKFVGIEGCDMANFQGLLRVGYWIGCSQSKVLTGVCPLSYCKYNADHSETGLILIPRTCDELEQSSLCNEHRSGKLCGECEDGFSAYFHSEKFSCGDCHSALGILFYILAELLPLILVFVLVMALNLNITSGLMQSFLLFSQTLFIINHVPSLRQQSNTTETFISVHTLIVGFFNLYFFHMDEISFCLWKDATILDIIAFHYVTTLFTIILLSGFILVVKQNAVSMESVFAKWPALKKIEMIAKKVDIQKRSIIHGISAFLILSYTQYTLTSMQIINRTQIYRENGEVDQNVVYFQGNLRYFGEKHLPYAVPAVLVLLFLSLPPPIVLISYPLLWKIKAKLGVRMGGNDDTTPWLIRKLLPLIDSFQGVFRDNYRMFAGLFFLWRFILTAIFTFASTLSEFFLLTEIALLIMFAFHTLARPYKRRFHNIVDAVMLANMALITLLKWYTSVASTGHVSDKVINFIVSLQLLLMYIPLVIIGGFIFYWTLKRYKCIPEKLNCSKIKQNEVENIEKDTKNLSRKGTVMQQATCADEDLFSRAAELNSGSVTCSEAGVDLETNITTTITLSTT